MKPIDVKLYAKFGNRIAVIKAMVFFGLIHNALQVLAFLLG